MEEEYISKTEFNIKIEEIQEVIKDIKERNKQNTDKIAQLTKVINKNHNITNDKLGKI